jgi:uncharacterized protein (TIGR02246 family)
MGVKSPSEMPETFGKLFNARDKNGLLDLYAADAMFTLDGATSARGKAAIGEVWAPLFEGPLKLKARCASCHVNGGTAILRTDWAMIAPDESVAMTGSSGEVLRREADGRWRLVIDDATFSSRPGQA